MELKCTLFIYLCCFQVRRQYCTARAVTLSRCLVLSYEQLNDLDSHFLHGLYKRARLQRIVHCTRLMFLRHLLTLKLARLRSGDKPRKRTRNSFSAKKTGKPLPTISEFDINDHKNYPEVESVTMSWPVFWKCMWNLLLVIGVFVYLFVSPLQLVLALGEIQNTQYLTSTDPQVLFGLLLTADILHWIDMLVNFPILTMNWCKLPDAWRCMSTQTHNTQIILIIANLPLDLIAIAGGTSFLQSIYWRIFKVFLLIQLPCYGEYIGRHVSWFKLWVQQWRILWSFLCSLFLLHMFTCMFLVLDIRIIPGMESDAWLYLNSLRWALSSLLGFETGPSQIVLNEVSSANITHISMMLAGYRMSPILQAAYLAIFAWIAVQADAKRFYMKTRQVQQYLKFGVASHGLRTGIFKYFQLISEHEPTRQLFELCELFRSGSDIRALLPESLHHNLKILVFTPCVRTAVGSGIDEVCTRIDKSLLQKYNIIIDMSIYHFRSG